VSSRGRSTAPKLTGSSVAEFPNEERGERGSDKQPDQRGSDIRIVQSTWVNFGVAASKILGFFALLVD
jgi:hypothetical protein